MVVGQVDSVVQAGLVGQPQDLLEQLSAEVVEAAFQDEVEDVGVLLVPMMAEVNEVLNVEVSAQVLQVLKDHQLKNSFLFDPFRTCPLSDSSTI